MTELDRPDWKRGDTLTSIKDFAIIGGLALKECMVDFAAWLDTRLADRINRPDDES